MLKFVGNVGDVFRFKLDVDSYIQKYADSKKKYRTKHTSRDAHDLAQLFSSLLSEHFAEIFPPAVDRDDGTGLGSAEREQQAGDRTRPRTSDVQAKAQADDGGDTSICEAKATGAPLLQRQMVRELIFILTNIHLYVYN